MNNLAPTVETYQELETAFDFFNAELFDGQIPSTLITLQRNKRTLGYYSHERFVGVDSGAMVDEIAMNPSYFAIRPIDDTLSTLVHEMVHAWQFHHGAPGRKGYHNLQWASRMEDVGLVPSDNGQLGGKRVGQSMDHYIAPEGPFAKACKALLTRDFTLSWLDRYPPIDPGQAPTTHMAVDPETGMVEEITDEIVKFSLDDLTSELEAVLEMPTAPKSNRTKYRCVYCEVQVWGKPGLRLLCGEETCEAAWMQPVE